ncbi:MAG: hypothetical protein AB8B53_06325 [Flavobacteriales bacterium]
MKHLLVFLLIAATFTQCSTDVDLTAPYEDITVVYGLMDQTQDIQFVKINKAFLGDAALADMAQVRDSIEYDEGQILSKRIEEWSGNSLIREFELKDTLVTAVNPTIFYNPGFTDPERTVFYFETPSGFSPDNEYRLVIDFENKESVTASTVLITNNPVGITNPSQNNPAPQISFATSQSSINGSYPNFTFRWFPEDGAKRYELSLEFTYIEHLWTTESHTNLVSSEEKVLSWNLGSVIVPENAGGDNLDKVINGEQFYTFVASQLEVNPLVTREVGVLNEEVAINYYSVFNFVLAVGDEDLNSYIEFSEPVTSLAQEKPQWTNVNNGQGLFSSRLIQMSDNVKIENNSLRELCTGQHTFGLNFCTKDLAYDDETYFCN